MSFTILSRDEAAQDDAPRFPYSFVTVDGTLIGANDYTGLCEALIDGYADIEPVEGEDPHMIARFHVLAKIAGGRQAMVLAADDEINTDELNEDELTALFTPKDGKTLLFEHWPHDNIPLILLAEQYVPFTEFPAPTGDGIIWVSSHTELRFVHSLVKLGFGTAWVDPEMRDALDIE